MLWHSKSVTILDRPNIFNGICKNFFTTYLLFQCGISIKKIALRLKRLAEMETEVLIWYLQARYSNGQL